MEQVVVVDGLDVEVPSPMRKADGRYDDVKQRIETFRKATTAREFKAPEGYENDEEFWGVALRKYGRNLKVLGPDYADRDKEVLRNRCLTLAFEDAKETMEETKRALTDPLTGLYSRRALDTHLKVLMGRGRQGIKTGILMVDIDHFKLVNDTYGHGAGDDTLKGLADILRGSVRAFDIAGRYGGEEFILILHAIPDGETAADDIVAAKAELIRRTVEEKLQVEGKPIHISVGAITISDETHIKDIYDKVDAHLYEAKNNGRNVVIDNKGKITNIVMSSEGKVLRVERAPLLAEQGPEANID